MQVSEPQFQGPPHQGPEQSEGMGACLPGNFMTLVRSRVELHGHCVFTVSSDDGGDHFPRELECSLVILSDILPGDHFLLA